MEQTKKTLFSKIKKNKTFLFLSFSFITIIGFAVFYLYPIIRTVFLSFSSTSLHGKPAEFVGFDNFIKILTVDPYFYKSLSNTFLMALGSGTITLVIALFTAILLNSKVKGVSVYRLILFLPFIIPAFAASAIFKGLFDPNVGIINILLRNLGVENPPGWFLDENTALLTMILMSVWGFGVQMLIFLAALQNVPKELYEAAEIDGGGRVRIFFRITMPMIAPMLFLNVVLVTINGMKGFSTGYLIGGLFGEPNSSTLLLPVLIYRTAFSSIGQFRIGYASAMSWIFFLILLVLTLGQFILSKLYVKKDIN